MSGTFSNDMVVGYLPYTRYHPVVDTYLTCRCRNSSGADVGSAYAKFIASNGQVYIYGVPSNTANVIIMGSYAGSLN